MNKAVHKSTQSARRPRELDQFFESYYRLRPVNATFTGVHQYDTELPDWSLEGLERAAAEMRDLHRTLDEPPADDSVDGALARGYLEIQLAEQAGPHFQRGNPALWTGEAIFSIISLMSRDFAPAETRFQSIRARLEKIPRFLADAESTIGRLDVPSLWRSRALRECQAAATLLARSLPDWFEQNTIPAAAREAVATALRRSRAAFARFAEWVNTKDDAAPDVAKCGSEFFALLMTRGHFESRSPTELLREATAALNEETASWRACGHWPEIETTLAGDQPSPDSYLIAFQTKWDECRAFAESNDLLTWPDYPLRYVPMPAWATEIAPELYFLFYRSPAPFDSRPTAEYLTPEAGHATRSAITLNHVVHHGAIGHHVQNYYAYRNEGTIAQIAAVDCASRIGMFCGGTMAEGWACYATDLMDETGFLTDLERMSEQHSRVRQAARAVVDLSLHAGRMTGDDAVQFHVNHTGMPMNAAQKEVARTSMFPGTAIMYWLGTEGIHRLRRNVSRKEGSGFRLRRFHDRLLSHGSIPVNVIARLMTGGTP